MRIANIRLGHATNSSSSHSIIKLPDGEATLSSTGTEDYTLDGEYGWGNFTLTTEQEKLEYLAANMGSQIERMYGSDVALSIMLELFPTVKWNTDWFVDHQSELKAPIDAATDQISYAFIRDVQEWLSKKDIAILGGNDTGDEYWDNPLLDYRVDYPITDMWGKLLARKDGQWWTLYTQDTGAKIRFSFEDTPNELVRGSGPELVDIKITDYCTFGCTYCYQGSTSGGSHATLDDIKDYATALKEQGVFEVALGGGEPVLHPQFLEIVKTFKDKNITPNFTTRCTPDKWSSDVLKAVKEYVGAFAVSVSNAHEVEKVEAACTLYGFNNSVFSLTPNVSVQYVVGTGYSSQLNDIIEACNGCDIPLTLLGFKEVGRGEEYKQKENIITAELIKSANRLSVDTSFVDLYGDALKAANVPDVCIVQGEGRFSMYIDAVKELAGISSYHTDTFVDCDSGKLSYSFEELWKTLGRHVKCALKIV